MKLRISKACDLSSISVLPPRRTGGLSSGQGTSQSQIRSQSQTQQSFSQVVSQSQLRSQSQQSFSQGISQSQLSQASFDESLINDQRYNSNENNSSKVINPPPLPASNNTREESLQLSKATNNFVHRWNSNSNSSSLRENRCNVSEEIEQRLRQLDSTINRMGIILDSVQNDVLQINRAVKEISHDNEGIRQKMAQSDNSLQQVLKGEENIKAVIEESLKGIYDLLAKNSNANKLSEISSVLSALPDNIQANFAKLHSEIIRLFSKETEIIVNNIKSFSSRETVPIQTATSRPAIDIKPLGKPPVPTIKLSASNLIGNKSKFPISNIGEQNLKLLQPKLTNNAQTLLPQKEVIPVREKLQQNVVISLDSDEESDGSASCVVIKKEIVKKEIDWMKESREDTLRILRKARKRKRKQMSSLVIKDNFGDM